MGAFIAKQPNGLYCRFSSVVDCPTHWNMTEEEYIEFCAEEARIKARFDLTNKLRPFDDVKEHYRPQEMSETDFAKCLQEMSEPKQNPENIVYNH